MLPSLLRREKWIGPLAWSLTSLIGLYCLPKCLRAHSQPAVRTLWDLWLVWI